MAEIIHNAIRASYPIWIMCDKCNGRVELVRARSCIEEGEYITVIDINHKCKEKEKASTLTEEDNDQYKPDKDSEKLFISKKKKVK